MFFDTLKTLSKLQKTDFFQYWRVSFDGEEGVDAGGLYREFCFLITQKLFAAGHVRPKKKGKDANDLSIGSIISSLTNTLSSRGNEDFMLPPPLFTLCLSFFVHFFLLL